MCCCKKLRKQQVMEMNCSKRKKTIYGKISVVMSQLHSHELHTYKAHQAHGFMRNAAKNPRWKFMAKLENCSQGTTCVNSRLDEKCSKGTTNASSWLSWEMQQGNYKCKLMARWKMQQGTNKGNFMCHGWKILGQKVRQFWLTYSQQTFDHSSSVLRIQMYKLNT